MSEFKVREQRSSHNWRTEIPNIAEDILKDPYIFRVYCKLKRIAGDEGECYTSSQKLADACKMSKPQFIEMKQMLATPSSWPELGGKAFIEIQKCKYENGGDAPDLITIIDIWPENMAHFEAMKKAKSTPHSKPERGGIQDRGWGKPGLQGGVNDVYGGGKPGLHKEDLLEEEPKKESSSSSPPKPEPDKPSGSKEEMRKRISCTDQEFEDAWKKLMKRGLEHVPVVHKWLETVILNDRQTAYLAKQQEIIRRRKAAQQMEKDYPESRDPNKYFKALQDSFVVSSEGVNKEFRYDDEEWKQKVGW